MKTTLFVMSATGGSLHVARILAKALGETEIVLLPHAEVPTQTERVGLISPVYDGFPSPCVTDFIRGPLHQADKSPLSYLFCISTCAKTAAFAPQVLERLLAEAGCALSYHDQVKTIGTQVGLFPIPSKPNWDAILDAAEQKTLEIAQEIKEDAIKLPRRKFLVGFQMKQVMPKAFKLLASTAKDLACSDVCISCKACMEICPTRNITMQASRPVFGPDCIGCFACLLACPKQAILYQGRNWQVSYINPRSHIETARSAQWKANSTK